MLSSIAASKSEVAWLVRQRAASRGLDELDASTYLKRGGGSAEERRAEEPERGGGGAERGSLESASLRSSTKSTPGRTPRAVEETPRSELVSQLHQLVSRLPVSQDRLLLRHLR